MGRKQLKANGERLWARLMEMAQIGATEGGGVCRLALTDEDRRGRDLFCAWANEAGCDITIDSVGNIFAIRPGASEGVLPIAAGSHLDSQPTGGRFDGVLGVLAALEVIDSLNDHRIATDAPIAATVWTNEEGARFTPAMLGSGVYSGEFDQQYADARYDDSGCTFGAELSRIGYRGAIPAGSLRLAAHLELHIEQGPILEAQDTAIGVVSGVQGIRWYELRLYGTETHAGPTPMQMRDDPVRAFAGLVPDLYALAESRGTDARCSIGRLQASPGSTNTVPGSVFFSLDLRHPDSAVLDDMHHALQELIQGRRDMGARIDLDELWYSPPVCFDADAVAVVERSASDLAPSHMTMVSGAGHDSVYLSRCVPTAMIFIPCRDGISHNETEFASQAHVSLGADVLLNAVYELACRED
jgi:beta-ureidopropionase / N-carbamoyl-L-amino-acid hydrolase